MFHHWGLFGFESIPDVRIRQTKLLLVLRFEDRVSVLEQNLLLECSKRSDTISMSRIKSALSRSNGLNRSQNWPG